MFMFMTASNPSQKSINHQLLQPSNFSSEFSLYGLSCETGISKGSGDLQQELVLHVPCNQETVLRARGDPAIYELDEDARGKEMEWALTRFGCNPPVPAVFIGGKFVGSANTILTLQLNGSLKNLLKNAGAIWL